jgi:hypothetical protein
MGPRTGEGPMEDSEFQSHLDALITHAVQYIDEDLSPERAKATDYYMGRPFGNEQAGRSQFVSTDVRDTINQEIPSILRVVFGPEHTVEYRPRTKDDVAAAEQATDAIQYAFREENPGFLASLAVLKDGLIRKIGAFKWWWDDTSSVQQHKLEGVSQEQLELLGAEEELEFTRISPEPLLAPGAPPTFTVEVTRNYSDGCLRIEAVPPEELIFDRNARSTSDFSILGHRSEKTTGELLAMGVPEKDIEAHGGPDTTLDDNLEAVARRPNAATDDANPEAGKANRKHAYFEVFVRVDYDGDGTAELRRVCALGPGRYVVENEPVEGVNLSLFCPDPEPHTLVGLSEADRLMDVQRLKSQLYRSLLDSAAASIFPRVAYREGRVNVQDVNNTAIGAGIRVNGQPSNELYSFTHPFMGKELIPVIEMANEVIERRTGRSKGALGLDQDALQSSTPGAVTAAVTASQERTEMLVRIFAEMTLKPMFRGLLKLFVSKQPRAKMMKLRNQWVEVDPRAWDADMDVQVNVALGAGLVEERISTLAAIADKQQEIITNMGLQNPVVTVKQWRDTLAEIAELRGRKNSDRYFLPITEDQVKQMAEAAAQQPPPPDPAMVLAEGQIAVERMKVEAKIALERQEAELEMWKAREENDRQRDKVAADIQLKLLEFALEHQMDVSELQHKLQIERERASSQRAVEEEQAKRKPRKQRVRFERDPETGKLVGAEFEQEDSET